MNIAEKMRELIPMLHAGINEITFPEVKPECEEEWSADYAIVRDAYYDADDCGHYFDDAKFRYDAQEFIRNHFDPRAVVVHVGERADGKPPVGTIVIRITWFGSDEIEVYRVREKRS